MSAILNSLNDHDFLIFQSILMTLVSKFMVNSALSSIISLLLGLRSPLTSSPLCSSFWRYRHATIYNKMLKISSNTLVPKCKNG